MSIVPLVNPFGPYIKQRLPSLQGRIEKWLAGYGKTIDDVAWWEMTSVPNNLYPFVHTIYIAVIFTGSKDIFYKTFIWNTLEQMRNTNE